MIITRHTTEHPARQMAGTIFRIWVVGFVLAAKGTMWMTRKMLRLLPLPRSMASDE
jgi:hypothetical protein